ncbi:MAG TPA: hypothetical protein VFB66_13170 [Tepidisphaeraceae bacterium]|nr:hypothetical protein [Tepidisphaeraceae bacterium]
MSAASVLVASMALAPPVAQDFFPSRYVPFLYPVPAWHVWYLLAVPLCAAVAIVYKSIRCRSMKKVPKEAAKATAWILIGLAAAAVTLALVVELVERTG